MIQMNGLKNKIISCILSFFLVLGSVSTDPFFSKRVQGAEIGMVGALPGSVTLWEIFETLFVGAGIIIANEEIQNSASSHLGSSSYTLEEMTRLGFIPIPTDGSSALDWDWEDLENDLANSNSQDTKIIRDVFSQNGGQGSGGDDNDPDNDPWYKKAINWVKYAVANGKIELTNQLSNGIDSVTMSLTSLAGMIGACYNDTVDSGFSIPAYESMSSFINVNGDTLYTYLLNNSGAANDIRWYKAVFYVTSGFSNMMVFVDDSIREINPTGARPEYTNTIVIANRNNSNIIVYEKHQQRGASVVNNSFSVNAKSYRQYNIVTNKNNGQPDYLLTGNRVIHTSTPVADAQSYINGSDYQPEPIKSPDIITQVGNAQPNNDGMWVPTPYMEPGTHLEIIPQPNIDEFTQYITEENPEIAPAAEAWIDTVSPFIHTNPTPAPTTRPQPTTKPNVTPIPAEDPGGEDNPINITEPDPMPNIEDGFGTTFDLMDYFPFCIPADFVRAYKIFEVSDDYRQAPYIDYNLRVDRFGIDEHIILDFQMFDSAAALFRILIFITFCISLTIITKTLIWG